MIHLIWTSVCAYALEGALVCSLRAPVRLRGLLKRIHVFLGRFVYLADTNLNNFGDSEILWELVKKNNHAIKLQVSLDFIRIHGGLLFITFVH